MKSILMFLLLSLAAINNLTQSSLIDIDQNLTTTPEPSPQNRMIIVRQKIDHSKYIKEQQLDFAINLIENLNGKVIFKHESKESTSNKGHFEYVNTRSAKQKARIEKLIIDEKQYYHKKYPYLMQSTFLNKNQYVRNNISFNLKDEQTVSQFIDNQKQLPFCILIPSYNNAKPHLYRRNIDSILQQQYSNYHIVYMDDASNDQTTDTVINYLMSIFPDHKYNGRFETSKNERSELNGITVREYQFDTIRWKFVQNEKRQKAMFNIYHGALKFCGDDQIVVLVDGDDGFTGTQVLRMMSRAYRQTESLFVYTSYAMKKDMNMEGMVNLNPNQQKQLSEQGYMMREYGSQDKKPVISYEGFQAVTTYEIGVAGSQPDIKMIEKCKLRQTIKFLLGSHILSFYTALLRKAPLYHFMGDNGRFLDYAYDTALTLGLSELASKRTLFFKEVLYEYTAATGINDSPENWSKATWLLIAKSPSRPLSDQDGAGMVKRVLYP